MARAAVLPPSPVKRGTRTAPRTNVTKATTASSRAKATVDAKKRAPVKTPAYDSDDTEDELGMMMQEDTKKTARPRGPIAGRPPAKTATTRGRKAGSAPASAPAEEEEASKPEPTKKRVGRPRKNPDPAAPPAEAAPKPRGRPRAGTTAKTATTTRKNTRAAAGDAAAADDADPKHIVIATNSTTMRSNLLRGPAKKKTVTFQEASESESEVEEPAPAAGRKKAAPKGSGAGKAGLGASPVRKPAATAGRGRKPAAAKKETTKPLSPKKAKQMAKCLSAYASSDGEEDELFALKDDTTSPVKLVVHSPAKHGSENTGLSSPVRRINFTPKKASSMIDENGEPKAPTPKHGSTGTGLGSPVRKINFTPNRSHNAVVDNGHLALPPGKAIDFSDSVFMSSPARRPEPSPFKFTLRGEQSIQAQDFSGAISSPLKMSPKKGHLGASFSQSQSKASDSTPSFPARSSLFQSPPKKIASPSKSSLLANKPPVGETGTPTRNATPAFTSPVKTFKEATPYKSLEAEESTGEQDLEMVQEVARDIFGIELHSDHRTPSQSSSPKDIPAAQQEAELEPDAEPEQEAELEQEADLEAADLVDPGTPLHDNEDGDVDEMIEELQEEIRREPEDFGTICFSTMEDLQEPFKNLPENEHTETEVNMDSIAEQDEPVALDEQETHHSEPEDDSASLLEEEERLRGEQQDDGEDTQAKEQPGLSSDATLDFAEMEETQTPVSIPRTIEDDEEPEVPIDEHFAGSTRQLGEENEAENEDEQHDDEPIFAPSETNVSSLPRLPYELYRAEASPSPVEKLGSIPPLAPTPPAARAISSSHSRSPSSVNRLFDINLDLRIDVEGSPLDSTQNSIPTPPAPRCLDTPSAQSRRRSNFNRDAGFTPLAQRFDRWEVNTPAQDRPARPRRRGAFSLVGPLEQCAGPDTPEAGDVSYPDLSHTPLANTPSLFAELPLQDQNDDTCMVPESPAKSSIATEDHEMFDSPHKSDIFEDPQPETLDLMQARESVTALEPVEDDGQHSEEEDKENYETAFVPPSTPVKGGPSPTRTVHTVSKVPLKGEGEISPLKVPRKRGLSLSSTSPTRTSPRIRKSMFFPRVDSPPVLSPPRKSPRVERSPSPKRRCSSSRRTSAQMPAMVPPKSPSVAGSPTKTPRRNPSPTKQTLRGAVVHVDVHTTEGEDASGIFVELLQQMGARCVKAWSWNPRMSLSPVDGEDLTQPKVGITHVVYKDGGLRTLEKVKQASGLVKCVGVGWVLDCECENKWLDEAPYAIDSSIVPRGGAKRRKSMEPRALSNVNGTVVHVAEPSTPSASGRRSGADHGAMVGYRKITPPTPSRTGEPSTPTRQTPAQDRRDIPATPGYNFANLDAIGMSPATPYFLSSRAQLVQKSCPPKQTGRGLFPVSTPSFSLEEDEEEARRQKRARMEAARRKSHFYKPSSRSPLAQ